MERVYAPRGAGPSAREDLPVRLSAVAVIITAVAACTSSSSGAQDGLQRRLSLPDGFVIKEFARVGGARFMALGPDGSVYVSRPASDEVVRLADADGDGTAESQVVAVSGLNRPHGLAFHGGFLYIANTDGVMRVRLGPDGEATGDVQRVASYSGGGGHWSRSIAFGADSAMYVAIGSTCNVCIERTPDRAAVMRFDENGDNGRVYSSGLRNAVGIAMHPVTKQMWVTLNERDNIEPDTRTCRPTRSTSCRTAATTAGRSATGIECRARMRIFTTRRGARQRFCRRSRCRRIPRR